MTHEDEEFTESFSDLRSLLNSGEPIETPLLYHLLLRKRGADPLAYRDMVLPYVMGSRFKMEGHVPAVSIGHAKACHELCPNLPISLMCYEHGDFEEIEFISNFNIVKVEAIQRDIEDLSPVAKLKSLKVLNLDYNGIYDLSPLRGLTSLEELTLSNNGVESVEPLRGLVKMIEMDLGHNRISFVEPLSGMINVQALSLDGNPVQDISSLTHLKGRYRT